MSTQIALAKALHSQAWPHWGGEVCSTYVLNNNLNDHRNDTLGNYPDYLYQI